MPISSTTISSCGGYDIKVNPNQGWNYPVKVKITPASGNANGTADSIVLASEMDMTATFVAPSPGHYDVTVIGSCGRSCTTQNVYVAPINRSIELHSLGCSGDLDSVSTITLSVTGMPLPWTVKVLSGPTTYQSSKMGLTLTRTYPFEFTVNSAPWQVFDINNAPPGTYEIEVKDACDTVKTITVNVGSSNLNRYNLVEATAGGCFGSRFINSTTSVPCGNLMVTITKEPNNAMVGQGINATNGFLVQNMAPGTYYLNYYDDVSYPRLFDNPNFFGGTDTNQNIIWIDTLVVAPSAGTPSVAHLIQAECGIAVNVLMVPDSSVGVPPYQFEIISGPTGPSPVQASPSFNNLSQGFYTFRISDSCGNSSTTSIDVEGLVSSPVTLSGTNCIGNNLNATHSYVYGNTYYWIKPNQTIAHTDTLTFSPVTLADTGTYYLVSKAEVNGCIDSGISSFTILEDCTVLPVTLKSFEVTERNCRGLAQWTSGVELDIDGYELQISNDGLNFITVAQMTANGSGSSYQAAFDVTKSKQLIRLKILERLYEPTYSDIKILWTKCDNKNISVYPNPASDMLHIIGLQPGYRIIMEDILGRTVLAKVSNEEDTNISLVGLANGTYNLRVVDQSGSIIFTQKIVKQ